MRESDPLLRDKKKRKKYRSDLAIGIYATRDREEVRKESIENVRYRWMILKVIDNTYRKGWRVRDIMHNNKTDGETSGWNTTDGKLKIIRTCDRGIVDRRVGKAKRAE